MRGRNLNMIAFILICGMISYYDLKKCSRLPWPPRFIFAGLTFLIMEMITLFDETIGGVTSIGFVIAVALGTFTPQVVPGRLRVVSDCNPGTTATGQPQNTTLVQDVTSTADAGSAGMASVAEYQSSQPASMPGVQTL